MIEWYPYAQVIKASVTNYHAAGRASFDRIVIHETDGHGDARATANMWRAAGHGTSAHCAIGQDGITVQAISFADVAWHCHKANSRSVGIEICARMPKTLGDDDPGLPISTHQYVGAVQLVAWLCLENGLVPDRDTIQGHNEIDDVTTHTDCPTGCGFDWLYFMNLLTAEYERQSNAKNCA